MKKTKEPSNKEAIQAALDNVNKELAEYERFAALHYRKTFSGLEKLTMFYFQGGRRFEREQILKEVKK